MALATTLFYLLSEWVANDAYFLRLRLIFFIFFGQLSFPRILRPTDKTSINLYLEEVAVHAGNEALLEVDDCRALIVASPQRILGQQLMPHPMELY